MGLAGTRGSSAVTLVALAGAAVALAWALRLLGDQPIVFDSSQYVSLGRLLASGQIAGWMSRTYGYPAFLVPWLLLSGDDTARLRLLVFAAQMAVHLGASWLFARRVAQALGAASLGRVTLVLVTLNPFLLIGAGALLSDHLSAALIAIGVALLLPVPPDRRSALCRDGALALVTLALAAEVRPANAILLPVGALLWACRWGIAARRSPGLLTGGLVAVGVISVLPLVPQFIINWQVFNLPNPLVVTANYGLQMTLGVQNLKQATFVLRGHPNQATILYTNPFANGQTDIVELARANPPGLAATFALHVFGLFDQDYPYTYVREPDPWYRWPLAGVGYLFFWAAVAGVALGWRRCRAPGARLAAGTLAIMAAAYIVVYLPAFIECRFGLPLYVLLAPAVALTLMTARDRIRAGDWHHVLAGGASALLTVGACAWLSIWMQSQSSTLALTREILQAPGPLLPVASFDVSPPGRWTVEQRQTYLVRATNLGDRTWTIAGPGRVHLHVMFVGPGDAETVDSRVELRPPVDRDVPPGEQIAMEVTVAAPRKEGNYRLRHQMELEEQVGLSGSPPAETPVTVNERRR